MKYTTGALATKEDVDLKDVNDFQLGVQLEELHRNLIELFEDTEQLHDSSLKYALEEKRAKNYLLHLEDLNYQKTEEVRKGNHAEQKSTSKTRHNGDYDWLQMLQAHSLHLLKLQEHKQYLVHHHLYQQKKLAETGIDHKAFQPAESREQGWGWSRRKSQFCKWH